MIMKQYQIDHIKETYPPSSRIELLSMTDPYSPIPPNTLGTVDHVDSLGTLHCTFDNGRCLGVIPNEDSFRKLSSQATSKFHTELARVLKADGLQLQTKGGVLTVLSDGKNVCHINRAAEAFLLPNDESTELYHQVQSTAQKVREYVTNMESAPLLTAVGLGDGYKLLCEFNGAVLAGKDREEFGLQFITWERDQNGDLNNGHYFEENYTGAKQDFAQRSELIDQHKLFTQDQMVEIHRCITDTLENRELSDSEQEILYNTQRQIERAIPDIKGIIAEKIQQGTVQQFNM